MYDLFMCSFASSVPVIFGSVFAVISRLPSVYDACCSGCVGENVIEECG